MPRSALPYHETFSVRHKERWVELATTRRDRGEHLVVFLHGLGGGRRSFAGAFAAAPLADYSLCTLDVPGHGGSPATDRELLTVPTYAELVIETVARLGDRPVSVVGHGMGGAVGVLASQGLAGLTHLVSVEGNLVAADCDAVSRRIAGTRPDRFERSWLPSFLAELRGSTRPALHAWARWCAESNPAAIHESARSLLECSESDKLLGMFLGAPSPGYVYGARDAPAVRPLLARLPDVPTRRIEDSGRFPMVENPPDFYAAVADLLAGGLPYGPVGEGARDAGG